MKICDKNYQKMLEKSHPHDVITDPPPNED